MVISSTLFRRKNIHKATWVSAGEDRTKTQIDHVLIDCRTKIRARISNVFTNKGTIRCCVKVERHLSGSFKSKIGLRQSDGILTMLFNIALERMLGFADDIDIIGLHVNEDKTKFLIVRPSQ
jgi:hypothetical protein